MDKNKPKDKSKKPAKKAYVKPKIKKHGSLQGISERVTGATTACCLTKRAKKALKSRTERASLVSDVGELLSRA